MQRLVFETAWEKTIATGDRQHITAVFEQENGCRESERKFIPLWQTRNHRGDLLVTVIMQNFSDTILELDRVALVYYEKELQIAVHTFSYSGLAISPTSSMPWTFIFPKSKIVREPCLEDGWIQEDK